MTYHPLPHDDLSAYLTLAHQLGADTLVNIHLLSSASALPLLSSELLEQLTTAIETALYQDPAFSWALGCVATAAAEYGHDRLLLAKALFYQAMAANAFTQLDHIDLLLDKAQALFLALGQTGWVAACDWQRYSLVWRHHDSARTEHELQKSAEILATTPPPTSRHNKCLLVTWLPSVCIYGQELLTMQSR